MNKMIRNTKVNRISFFIAGIIFIFFGFFMPFFLIIGALLLALAHLTNKKYKELLAESLEISKPMPRPTPTSVSDSQLTPPVVSNTLSPAPITSPPSHTSSSGISSREISEVLNELAEDEEEYILFKFKVAGVTFKNGQTSRQSILKSLRWTDDELESEAIDFEVYEYEGEPAVYVKINDQVIGNIPANKVAKFLELEEVHLREDIVADIYGGNLKADGRQTNYGCSLTIRYYNLESEY